MKSLQFFSIKQKLAFFLLFLSCAVSYLVFCTIQNTEQAKQDNDEIEVVLQQKLILKSFLNSLFFTEQQSQLTSDQSVLNKQLSIFIKNQKAMQVGGEAFLSLNMQNTVNFSPDFDTNIKIEIQRSFKVWDDLQTFSQNLQFSRITKEQLSTVQYLSNNLHQVLTKITNSLMEKKTKNAQKNQLTLKITLLIILIITFIFYLLLVKSISQPLKDITQTTSRIRLGDLHPFPNNQNKRDELRPLYFEMDEIRTSINNLIIGIQQHNRQISLSSMQLGDFFNEIDTTYELQLNQYTNMEHQFVSLQKMSEITFQILKKIDNLDNSSNKIIDKVSQSINTGQSSLKDIHNNSLVCNDNIANLQQNAENLYRELENLTTFATHAQMLATKTALDAACTDKKITASHNQVIKASKKISKQIIEITPLLKLLQSQVQYLTTPLNHVESQITDLNEQLFTTGQHLQSLKEKVEAQQDYSTLLTKQNRQQELQIHNLQKTVESSLTLISENKNKSITNLLFIQELDNISQQIDALSSNFKTEDKNENQQRGEDKRLYPRISNQMKVSLHQGDKSIQGITQDISLSGLQMKSLQSVVFSQDIPVKFSISLPSKDSTKLTHQAMLFCDIVNFEKHEDIFYYRISFHTISPDSKIKIQQIFDYFNKASEYAL